MLCFVMLPGKDIIRVEQNGLVPLTGEWVRIDSNIYKVVAVRKDYYDWGMGINVFVKKGEQELIETVEAIT